MVSRESAQSFIDQWCGASPGRSPRRLSPATTSRFIYLLPKDILKLILAELWRMDAFAPRAAAVNHEFLDASNGIEILVERDEVAVPRKIITKCDVASINPRGSDVINHKFNLERSSWGIVHDNYQAFNVRTPSANFGTVLPFNKEDMASTLDLGDSSGYLNNVAVDAFFASQMVDVFTAGRSVAGGYNGTFAAIYFPACLSSLRTFNNLSLNVQEYMTLAIKNTKEVYAAWHFGETSQRANHWVLLRAVMNVKKIEIFESCDLVKDTSIACTFAANLDGLGLKTNWTYVLYNRAWQGMPRQHDGRSCGVFVCVVALHLYHKKQLPMELQHQVVEWRKFVAACIWKCRVHSA